MNNTAAIWSAIAASFSALAALFTAVVHRRNLLEAARPELVVTGWSRKQTGVSGMDAVTFNGLRNVGKGAAFHIYMFLDYTPPPNNVPGATLSTIRLPIVAPNESCDASGEIYLWWKNIPSNEGMKYLAMSLIIYAWDARNFRHETRYNLFAMEQRDATFAADSIAPNVMLTNRTTKTRSARTLKIIGRVRRAKKYGVKFLACVAKLLPRNEKRAAG